MPAPPPPSRAVLLSGRAIPRHAPRTLPSRRLPRTQVPLSPHPAQKQQRVQVRQVESPSSRAPLGAGSILELPAQVRTHPKGRPKAQILGQRGRGVDQADVYLQELLLFLVKLVCHSSSEDVTSIKATQTRPRFGRVLSRPAGCDVTPKAYGAWMAYVYDARRVRVRRSNETITR